MATTLSRTRTGFYPESVQEEAPLDGQRHIANGCPLYGAARLSVCRSCPHFGGFIDTGNAAPHQRWRLVCHGPTRRTIIPLSKAEARVHCPLVEFKLRNVKDCEGCPHYGGIERSPRGWRQKMLGLGIPTVLCAHPATKRIEEML